MFAEASSRLRTQAGSTFSAMPRTLRNLLKLSLTTDTDRESLISACELDPVILLSILHDQPPGSLTRWHEPLNAVRVLCHAASLCMEFLENPPGLIQWKAARQAWRDALVRSHIAEKLAALLGHESPHEAGLTALLSDSHDLSLGCLPPMPRDAIRFQHSSVEALRDADTLIRIVALSRRITEFDDTRVEEEFAGDGGIHGIDISSLRRAATEATDELLLTPEFASDLSLDSYHQELQDLREQIASFHLRIFLEQQLSAGASLETEIRRLGRRYLDLEDCRIFTRTDSGFRCNDTHITSPLSIVSRAARTGHIVTPDQSITVVDQQMLESRQSTGLVALPVSIGGEVQAILVAGKNWQDLEHRKQNLAIFADSVAGVLDTDQPGESISVSLVQRRAREITHEVNNPFSIIQNYLKILSLKLGEDHEAQPSITTISAEIQRASEIIRQFAGIGNPQVTTPGTTSCNPVLAELADMFSTSYPQIRFRMELDSREPLVNLSTDHFKQIIVNLVKNAAEAMDSSGEIWIRETAEVDFPDARYVELEISDTGPGVDPDLRENLFTSGVSTKPGPERGMGLAIVKEILTGARGMISFRTGSDGTSFRILIPQTEQTEPVQEQEVSP